MSKNIVLQNGTDYNYAINDVSKIRTDLQEGGTCDWVPEDETYMHITISQDAVVFGHGDLSVGDNAIIFGVSEI